MKNEKTIPEMGSMRSDKIGSKKFSRVKKNMPEFAEKEPIESRGKGKNKTAGWNEQYLENLSEV